MEVTSNNSHTKIYSNHSLRLSHAFSIVTLYFMNSYLKFLKARTLLYFLPEGRFDSLGINLNTLFNDSNLIVEMPGLPVYLPAEFSYQVSHIRAPEMSCLLPHVELSLYPNFPPVG